MISLNEAIALYKQGETKYLSTIWNYVEPLINWFKYYDPAGGYTIDDFKQECMIELWKILDKYDASKGKFTTFAKACLCRKLIGLVQSFTQKYTEDVKHEPVEIHQDDVSYDNIDKEALYKLTAEKLAEYISNPAVRELFEAVLFDRYEYFKSRKYPEKSALYSIAKKYKINVKHLEFLFHKNRQKILDFMFGEKINWI